MKNYYAPSLAVGLATLVGVAVADSPPSRPKSDVSRLPKDTAQLYADTKLFPREPKWQRIPWLIDLNEGIRLAKQEKRPVLIWTSGDDPLERC
jgi:hypothetical protein